jgi:hypothetical protein
LLAEGRLMQNDAHMEPKPHHRRHHRVSEQRQIHIMAGILLLLALALIVAFLWWTNNMRSGSP